MARVLGCYNVSLLIAVQPEMEWKAPWSKEETQADRDLLKRYPWYRRAMRVIYPQLLQAATNIAAEQGAAFVDLRAVFKDRPETIFIDSVHTNDRGNEIVAQALWDYCRATGLKAGKHDAR